jgi:8-amino-7-oxononanoate synthase
VSYLKNVEEQLVAIHAQHRYRELPQNRPSGVIDFSTNDYLALATDSQVLQAFKNATRVGSGGARLLGGASREHSLLEEELAAWLGRERALLFSSGYLAALGVIPVLARCVETIYSDTLNHASLIDGIRFSHTPRAIYEHGKVPAQRNGSSLIVTESIFSMDGDTVDLQAILDGMRGGDVLLVDDAHAIGVAGPNGAGLARALSDPRVVVLGTLSKSFGAAGGFVAGPARLIELLVNTARTFIFDTALPPAVALAGRVALVRMKRGDDRRARLRENVARLRAGLRALGLPAIDDPSPIVPVVLGDEKCALTVSERLLERKVYVPAVRPPTVPPGSSRLRFSVRSDHTSDQIDLSLRTIAECIGTS